MPRLQNSPYFCVFKHARAFKQKVWTETENSERDWRTNEARALRARKTLNATLYLSLLILRKKPTVLQSSSCLTIVIGIIFELNPFPACINRGNAVFIQQPRVHKFSVRTFTTPTKCNQCTSLMVGLVRQGSICEGR